MMFSPDRSGVDHGPPLDTNPLRLDVGQSQNQAQSAEKLNRTGSTRRRHAVAVHRRQRVVVLCRLVIEHNAHHHEITPDGRRSTTGPRSAAH